MPSPKAVLRDIHDEKLDPTKPHVAIRRSGRLRDAYGDVPSVSLRLGLVKLMIELEPTQPIVVEQVQDVVNVPEPIEQPSEVVVEPVPTYKKPNRFVKKVKKEEPEEPSGS